MAVIRVDSQAIFMIFVCVCGVTLCVSSRLLLFLFLARFARMTKTCFVDFADENKNKIKKNDDDD